MSGSLFGGRGPFRNELVDAAGRSVSPWEVLSFRAGSLRKGIVGVEEAGEGGLLLASIRKYSGFTNSSFWEVVVSSSSKKGEVSCNGLWHMGHSVGLSKA